MVGPPRRSLSRSSSHHLVRRLSSSASHLHRRHIDEDDPDAAILLNDMDTNDHEGNSSGAPPELPGEESNHTLVETDAPVVAVESPNSVSRTTSRHRRNVESVDVTTQRQGQVPRVRFSADIERAEPQDGPLRRSLQDPREAIPEQSSSSAAASDPGGVSLSPTPAPKRNRGYSLRRALFAKSILNQAGTAEESEDGASYRSSILSQSSSQGYQQDRRKPYIIPPEIDLATSRPSMNKEDSINVVTRPISDRSSSIQSESIKAERGRSASITFGDARWLGQKASRFDIRPKLTTFKDGFRKHVLRIKPIPLSKDGRHIDLDIYRENILIDERTNKAYCDNHIRSSRYSLWSFFPKQFIAQFSKLANFYFLLVAILQMIPGLSTTGQYTTIIPLLIFVGISMGKEGFDDLRRYRLDKEENARIAHVLKPESLEPDFRFHDNDDHDDDQPPSTTTNDSRYFRETKWIDIKVGDVIRLDRNQAVPADVVLLHADDPNGIAYIETMALDGETNLKTKQPCVPIARACYGLNGIINSSQKIHFAVEDPNSDLYKFEGHATVEGGEKMPLTNGEVILRGSILRNTKRALGMVIYTGEECKIRMNANKNPRIKAPALQAYVNRVVAVIVLFVVILAGACTIAYKFWSHNVENKSWYLDEADVAYGPVFTSFLIMYNTMIPISLYVSLEIVKVGQMYFMQQDVDLYDEDSNTPVVAQTSTINEELGQVSYIFSDKTGTLTNNSMHFRKMSVAGTAWLHDLDLLEEAALEEEAAAETARRRMSKGKRVAPRPSRASTAARKSIADPKVIARAKSLNEHSQVNNTGRTTEMLDYIKQKPNTAFARRVRFFILGMALCHTCLPEVNENDEISYQAASPDESALVNAAKELGYTVVDRQPNSLTIRVQPSEDTVAVDETFEILNVIEFSSTRKRMSIIVRMPDGRVCVFTKGADTTILKLLKRSGLASEKMAAVNKRTSYRKSLEAKEAIRRNSMQVRGSIHRSMSLPRRSLARDRAGPSMRQSMDLWLREREHDTAEAVRGRSMSEEHYNSRPSAQLRRSLALQEGRPSAQMDGIDEELVEETLVVNENQVFERCFQHLDDFATEGLRTLLYGYRYLDEVEYQTWREAYQEATTSLVDRQEKIERVGEEIETQLELLGATAIEDKLQKGVPEAIEKLRRANIKLWMLTGDKRETAINIGHSCHLVKDYSTLTILDYTSGNVDHTLVSTTQAIQKGGVAHSVVVVDGQTLSYFEENAVLSERFLDLAILVDSVICCRASPKQKAYLVSAIRKRVRKAITLAIGDGANDIAMIQEAHVGIGIAGKEGLQAARISDYSIAQFRFLLKLLLVHGRWNYVRVCKYTLGTFWKETLFYLTQALYQKWNGYTGTSMYEPWGLSMFNTLFTSLPVIFLGILEKDLNPATLLAVPELYSDGQRHKGFNVGIYLFWAFTAVCEAVMIYFIMFSLFGQAAMFDDNSIFPMGLMTYSAAVILINLKLQGLVIHYKTYFAGLVNFISIGGWWLWNIFLNAKYSNNGIYKVKSNFLHITGPDLHWWIILFVSVVCCLVYELLLGAVRTSFFPTDVDIFQEYEKDPYTRRRFEAASALEMAESWRPDPEKRAQEELAREREQEERVHIVEQLLERRRKIESLDSEYTVAEVENADGYNPLRNKASVSSAASAMAADAGAKPRPSVGTHELLRTGSVQRPPASS